MSKDDQTWLNLFYLILACLCGYIIYKFATLLSIQFGWEERYDSWLPMTRLIGSTVLGGLCFAYLKTNKDRQEYFLGAISELRKITWPSAQDTKTMTTIVVIFVVVVAIVLALFDYLFTTSLSLIL